MYFEKTEISYDIYKESIRRSFLDESSDLDNLVELFSKCIHQNNNGSTRCQKCKNQIEKALLINKECKIKHNQAHLNNESYIELNQCGICNYPLRLTGYLYACTNSTCKYMVWHNKSLLNFGKSNNIDEILVSSGVQNRKYPSKYVYVLYLRPKPSAKPEIQHCYYVGKTSKNPSHRYLQHLLGISHAKRVKTNKRVDHLVTFEGPMDYHKAELREKSLTLELTCPSYSN